MKLAATTGYLVAGISVLFGVLLATGLLLEEGPSPHMRVVLGVVLVLMGIHRYATIRMKMIQRTRDNV